MSNKKPTRKFSKAPQGLDEAKSKGQITRCINRNLIETLRSNLQDTDLISKIVAGVNEEVENGILKNGIELLKIAKEPDKQEIKLDGGLEVQKVFVEEKTKKKIDKHIDDFIDGK